MCMSRHRCLSAAVQDDVPVPHVPCQPYCGEVAPAKLPYNDIAAIVRISNLHQVIATCSAEVREHERVGRGGGGEGKKQWALKAQKEEDRGTKGMGGGEGRKEGGMKGIEHYDARTIQ